jgi:hypothetical protein
MHAGLCTDCRFTRVIRTGRGTVYYQCGKALVDARFSKYPRLPVRECPGYDRSAAGFQPAAGLQLAALWSRRFRLRPAGPPLWFLLLALVFALSRAVYLALGVRPDTTPIGLYLQYIDPVLLRNHLWQSLLYLREQPPGFNLYLGLVLKSPVHPEAIFLVIHLLMGLALAFSLLAVMMRLGVAGWLAFLLAALFTASPITVLYENWIFYEYPVMVSLIVAAWALERYIRAARFRDALIFFLSLAVVASVRGVFHLSWFLLLAAALLWITRDHWRRGLCAAAVPALLLLAFYAKNYVMFGDLVPGQVYKKMNYADMVQQQAPREAIERLKREGRIGGILEIPAVVTETPNYAKLVKQPPPTGIPLLDMPLKSTGADNWNSIWTARVADAYYRDAQVVARECPGLLWKQVRVNLRTYLRPATEVFPFDEAHNAKCLRPFLDCYERITAGELVSEADADPDQGPMAWLTLVLVPACLAAGLVIAVRAFSNRAGWTPESRARCAAILFLLFNIAYDSAVTILFSTSDHNRYREEVAPLYIVLLGLLVTASWDGLRGLFPGKSLQHP